MDNENKRKLIDDVRERLAGTKYADYAAAAVSLAYTQGWHDRSQALLDEINKRQETPNGEEG